jgi:hypothetical protein
MPLVLRNYPHQQPRNGTDPNQGNRKYQLSISPYLTADATKELKEDKKLHNKDLKSYLKESNKLITF